MVDVLDYLGQALIVFAEWLQKVSPIPWPFVFGIFFLPFVVVLRTSLWILRGTVWPVPCKYYHTQQRRMDKACRVYIPGEWHYCRHHRHYRVMSDKHICDPKIPRWQKRTRNGQLVDRDDIRGVGFVQVFSDRETLLFYKGITKRPSLVWKRLPAFIAQLPAGWKCLRQIKPRNVFQHRQRSSPIGVADRMLRVIEATRLALISFGAGLILTIVSIFLNHLASWRTGVEYASTTAFVLAWDFLRFGIWKEPQSELRWLKATVVDTVKSISLLIALAVAYGILNNH